jgi:hypothetical protein
LGTKKMLAAEAGIFTCKSIVSSLVFVFKERANDLNSSKAVERHFSQHTQWRI